MNWHIKTTLLIVVSGFAIFFATALSMDGKAFTRTIPREMSRTEYFDSLELKVKELTDIVNKSDKLIYTQRELIILSECKYGQAVEHYDSLMDRMISDYSNWKTVRTPINYAY